LGLESPILIVEKGVGKNKGQLLAKSLNLKFQDLSNLSPKENSAENQYYLVLGKERLYLKQGMNKRFNPICCDFDKWLSIRQKSNLLKCLKGLPPDCKVIDGTAGFGKDSLELAKVAKKVLLVERVPWMVALLKDGIKLSLNGEAAHLINKLEVRHGNIEDILASSFTADVIYLDPMFPEKGHAKAKKGIQALRDLTEEIDPVPILNLAMDKSKERVIVKRHNKSPFVSNLKPNFSIEGRVIRFDVYLV
jgi:16S rRNA G966 N2-methylase RsmD